MSELSTKHLAAWLKDNLDPAQLNRTDPISKVEIGAISEPKSGYSAETIIFEADLTQGGKTQRNSFVLRRETADDPIYPDQTAGFEVEIQIQYNAMRAIAEVAAAMPTAGAAPIPIAPLLGYEADPQILGAPFFMMGFVAGEVPIEDPNYTTSGFFFDAAPKQRRQMILSGIETMAAIHRIDWQAARLDWLAPPDRGAPGTARQIQLWEELTIRTLNGRKHPPIERGFEWLHANLPVDSPLGIAWGDSRLGNIIWDDFKPACVTDFEATAIAPPEFDLGWWLMFDRWSHDHIGGPRLEGEPDLSEQRDHYLACAEANGVSIDSANIFFQEVFAAVRYCAIVVKVMQRYEQRGDLPPDNTYWLDNPVVDCLNTLLPD